MPEPQSLSPLVSVVVPFYNVRDCVCYCMESLLGQTFSDFEIICVDDGSTDGTEGLLEAYSSDTRVHVLHKENSGLSDARNYGIQHARGQLISLVDGDDCVAPTYLEALYKALEESCADISLCGCRDVPMSRAADCDWPAVDDGKTQVFTQKEMVSSVLYGSPILSSWGKLIPKETYLEHPFPIGKAYEDSLTFEWHFTGFTRFAFVSAPLYGYVSRRGSITKESAPNESRVRNFEEALASVVGVSRQIEGMTEGPLRYYQALKCARLYRMAAKALPKSEYLQRTMDSCRNFIQGELRALADDQRVSTGDKFRFLVVAWLPCLYEPLMSVYERILKGMR